MGFIALCELVVIVFCSVYGQAPVVLRNRSCLVEDTVRLPHSKYCSVVVSSNSLTFPFGTRRVICR